MGRRKAFRVIAIILAVTGLGFGLFTAVFGIISEAQRVHALHNVVVATLLVVLTDGRANAGPDEAALRRAGLGSRA
jgi:Mg-chelatase subunit ChlD